MSRIKDKLMELEEKIISLRRSGYDWDEVIFELEDDGYDSFIISQAIAYAEEEKNVFS